MGTQLLSINIKLRKIVYSFKKNFAFISILGFCVSEITFLNYKTVVPSTEVKQIYHVSTILHMLKIMCFWFLVFVLILSV